MRINAVIAGVFVGFGFVAQADATRIEVAEGVVCSVASTEGANEAAARNLQDAVSAYLYREQVVIRSTQYMERVITAPFQVVHQSLTTLPPAGPNGVASVLLCLTIRHVGPVPAVAPVTPHLSPVQP